MGSPVLEEFDKPLNLDLLGAELAFALSGAHPQPSLVILTIYNSWRATSLVYAYSVYEIAPTAGLSETGMLAEPQVTARQPAPC